MESMSPVEKPWLLIGHRGVGKSTLAKNLEPGYQVLDLDSEIERQTGSSIEELIGKCIKNFRKLEGQILLRHLANRSNSPERLIIVAGAGIDPKYLERVKTLANILWVRRDSDREGRVFLDRPRLMPKAFPLEESKKLFSRRQSQYQAYAHEFLDLPEGPFQTEYFLSFIQSFLSGSLSSPEWSETLEPGVHWRRDLERIMFLQESRFVELRNDLLAEPLICEILQSYPHEKILLSIRKKLSPALCNCLKKFAGALDCDLAFEKNLDLAEQSSLKIISIHGEFQKHLDFVKKYRGSHHLKWAPTIRSLSQLIEAHSLCQSQSLSFLPISEDGRWKFYRLLRSSQNLLNFRRSRTATYQDQPTLWDLISYSHSKPNARWLGVLGQNTIYSWSPYFHQSYACARGENFFSLSLSAEPSAAELDFLLKLGLYALAVTSPFKAWAAKLCNSNESFLNTLVWRDGKWHGANTDRLALEKMAFVAPVLIWGAGAMGKLLKSQIRDAELISARTKKPSVSTKPHTLVWAAKPQGPMPPIEFCPQVVIDLNYFESSLARDYAARCGATYLGGEKFFVIQALAQQKFWPKEKES
jgi:shikimate kinase